MSSSVEESSAAAESATAEAGAEKGGKTKKKIKFPPGFKLIRLLKKLEKQVETNPRPDYLAKISELKEAIQRKRDEKRRHVTRKILKKQRAFLLRAFIKKVKEFRYKVENAAPDLPENVCIVALSSLTAQVLAERKRLLEKYTEELEIAKAFDLDALVTAAIEAVEDKPAEPTTREERIKQKLILHPDVKKYLSYKPGASEMTSEDIDIDDSVSEDSQTKGKKRRSEAEADADNDPFFGSGDTDAKEGDEEADPQKELAYARQSMFLDSLAQRQKKKPMKKKKEPYKPKSKNRPGQRTRQAMREGVPAGQRPRPSAGGARPAGAHPAGGARPPFKGKDRPAPPRGEAQDRPAAERTKFPSKISKPPIKRAPAKPEPKLHPSWEAKRQAEQQRQAAAFQGTKIKFDE